MEWHVKIFEELFAWGRKSDKEEKSTRKETWILKGLENLKLTMHIGIRNVRQKQRMKNKGRKRGNIKNEERERRKKKNWKKWKETNNFFCLLKPLTFQEILYYNSPSSFVCQYFNTFSRALNLATTLYELWTIQLDYKEWWEKKKEDISETLFNLRESKPNEKKRSYFMDVLQPYV